MVVQFAESQETHTVCTALGIGCSVTDASLALHYPLSICLGPTYTRDVSCCLMHDCHGRRVPSAHLPS
jgi:hypothetical protein